MQDLAGQVAVVSGSNRGIGRGIALALAQRGADVAVNYRTHAGEAEEVASAIRALGRRALVVQADVAKDADCARYVQQTLDEWGQVDICVTNAAYSVRKPMLELSRADFQSTLDVTLLGAFFLAQAAVRSMVQRQVGGAVLFVSSVHAFIPFKNCVTYNAAKAGLNNLAMTLAEELAPQRVRVNVLEPGWIDTPGERTFTSEEELVRLGKFLPWGRLGTIEEMGEAAAFLCSPQASYITGAVLRADGGFWLPSRGGSSQMT